MPSTNAAITDPYQELSKPVRGLLVCPYQLLGEAMAGLLKGTRFADPVLAGGFPEARKAVGEDPSIALVLLCSCDNDPEHLPFIRDVRKHSPDVRLVVLTAVFCAEELASCLDAGADGFLIPDMSALALIHSLDLVVAGEKVFPSRLAEEVSKGEVIVAPAPSAEAEFLSARERDILGYLVNGDSNKIIAGRLDCSEASVKMQVRQLFQKIGVANRTQAATWALSNGFAVTG